MTELLSRPKGVLRVFPGNEEIKITPTKSVLSGKNGTVAGVYALALSLERGKAL